MQVKHMVENKLLYFINTHAPQKPKLKKVLWNQLREILNYIRGSQVCVVGDYNCIRVEEESANCIYRTKDSQLFNNFIGKCNLFDLRLSNGTFTWFGSNHKKSRLDRILVNSNWMDLGDWNLIALSRKSSNHKGLVFNGIKGPLGSQAFQGF